MSSRQIAGRRAAARPVATNEYRQTYEPVTEATVSPGGYHFSNEHPRAPLTGWEQRVQDLGYPHVNTIKLPPGGKLMPHQHSSHNIHVVVRGSMKLNTIGHPGQYTVKETSQMEWYDPEATYGRVKELRFSARETVVPHQVYQAVAGRNGCHFVEGHQALSPTTQARFDATERRAAEEYCEAADTARARL